MEAVINCVHCGQNTRVSASSITIVRHETPDGAYELSRLFKSYCPRCSRNLQWHRVTEDTHKKMVMLIALGAKMETVNLTEDDLTRFKADLQREDFLSEIADYECYT